MKWTNNISQKQKWTTKVKTKTNNKFEKDQTTTTLEFKKKQRKKINQESQTKKKKHVYVEKNEIKEASMQTLDLQCCLHSWSINLYLKTLPTTVNNRL